VCLLVKCVHSVCGLVNWTLMVVVFSKNVANSSAVRVDGGGELTLRGLRYFLGPRGVLTCSDICAFFCNL